MVLHHGQRDHSLPRKLSIQRLLLLPAVGALVFLGCAKQGLPPGGPEDKTPPAVISTCPPPDSTLVGSLKHILVSFSEAMDRPSVGKAVFICPRLDSEPTFKWRRNDLTIILHQDLLADMTYVVTIGAGAQDLHGNPMAFSHTFAFATNDRVERGRIRGTISLSDGSKKAALVWAYRVADSAGVDPETRLPDYITQANEKGTYVLDYLASGRYRIFAVLDNNRDGRLSSGIDQLGISAREAVLTKQGQEGERYDFRLAPFDTTVVQPVSAEPLDQFHLQIRFDGGIDGEEMSQADLFPIVDTTTKKPLAVRSVSVPEKTTDKLLLVTGLQQGNTVYEIVVKQVTGKGGRKSQATTPLEFSGSNLLDSIGPALTRLSPADSARDLLPDAQLELTFSEPLDTSCVLAAELYDSAKDTTALTITWQTPFQATLKPVQLLKGNMKYHLVISLVSCRDAAGNAGPDSLVRGTYFTIDPDKLGSLSGIVETDSIAEPGPVVIQLLAVPGLKVQQQLRLPGPGRFQLPYLRPGDYRLFAFIDRDGNNRYSTGGLIPYVPAEVFYELATPVTIRPQWEVEDVILRF